MAEEVQQEQAEAAPAEAAPAGSQKKRLVAFLLCFFLGPLGIHRFYVGKVGTAILQIVTIAGFFGIWILIDLILILMGKFTDKQGAPLTEW